MAAKIPLKKTLKRKKSGQKSDPITPEEFREKTKRKVHKVRRKTKKYVRGDDNVQPKNAPKKVTTKSLRHGCSS